MDAVRHRTGTPCLFVLVPERLVFVVLEFVDGGIYVYVCEFVSSLGSPCPHVHASSSTVRPASYAVQHPNGWGTNSHNGVIVVCVPFVSCASGLSSPHLRACVSCSPFRSRPLRSPSSFDPISPFLVFLPQLASRRVPHDPKRHAHSFSSRVNLSARK